MGSLTVGITYDLQQDYIDRGWSPEAAAEFDRPETIDAIAGALENLGYRPDRIGSLPDLIRRLVAGDRWDLVFNIAEGHHGFGREAQIPALLEAYQIPFTFSDALVLALTLHKGLTKRIIRDLGLPTPDFTLIERMEEADGVTLPCPLFVKPVAEGTSKGISPSSKVSVPEDLREACRILLEQFDPPLLVETFLPGREFTVGIVGTGPEAKVLGVLEVHLREKAEAEIYTYENKRLCESLVEYRLVRDALAQRAADLALAAWRGLGCRDGGRVDIRADGRDRPYFLEVNPLAGLHPDHSDLPILCNLLGISYAALIGMIVASALSRRPCRNSDPSRPPAAGITGRHSLCRV